MVKASTTKKKYTEILITRKRGQKALPTLFYNKITSVLYREIDFERFQIAINKDFFEIENLYSTKAYEVYISPDEVESIQNYVQTVVDHKVRSVVKSARTEWARKYEESKPRYFQGFVGEYAFVKLALGFKLPATWDDQPRQHNVGDNGDVDINGIIIDIKNKDYNVCSKNKLYHDISESKVKKCHYFIFTFMKIQPDGSAIVDILGYKPSIEVEKLPTEKRFKGSSMYMAKRAFYNDSDLIEDFFNLPF